MKTTSWTCTKSVVIQILGVLLLTLGSTVYADKKIDNSNKEKTVASAPAELPQSYSCAYYRYDFERKVFLDSNSEVVNCNQSHLDIQNARILPYFYYAQGHNFDDCSGWNWIHSATYVPANWGDDGLVCVRQASCLPGYGGAAQFGPLYFGSILSICN